MLKSMISSFKCKEIKAIVKEHIMLTQHAINNISMNFFKRNLLYEWEIMCRGNS